MNRHIVYPGQIPLDTDILNAIQDGYYGNGWLAESIIGTGNAVVGLAVAPTIPASLQVTVAPGAIYSLQTVDSSAYGSLGTDANQFVKQGLSKTSQTLTVTPPTTTGQSQNYLVQVAFSEVDSGAITLPYYNASDPSIAWNGPDNSGTAQNTVRQDLCVIQIKAGVPAATGSQTTPSPDAGFIGLYVITVANGATTVTSGNISLLTTAPYFPTLPQIPTAVQNGQWIYAGTFGGSATALTATLSPVPASLVAGMVIRGIVASTNTGSTTVNLNGLGAISIVKNGGASLAAGDLVALELIDLAYDGTNFNLMTSPKSGFSNRQIFTSSGSFTPPTGVTKVKVSVWGSGGGSGGTFASGSGSQGGGGGGFAQGIIPVTPGTGVTVTIGAGGAAGLGTSTPTAGGNGGTSSFGASISATGGAGGIAANAVVVSSVVAAGGTGSGGDLQVSGCTSDAAYLAAGTNNVVIGKGGASFGGMAAHVGLSSGSSSMGVTGIFPGGGASGSGNQANGAAGAGGLVIVEY
ncbi:hypothetical protein [Rhizobium sp. RCAM05973]|uniref:glycine-rich domain-containing protein n=1 Tax=Rhizobium sp. RCAM05973 TaxID=2994066 RepID=UPI0022EBC676|nr:hypothetical protein [Rhizobium sp. RCAM05973]